MLTAPALTKAGLAFGRSCHLSRPTPGWDMKHCGFFWKSAATASGRDVVLDGEEIADHVAAHEKFDLAGDEQHAAVRGRAALQNRDVEPVFFVSSVDQGLIVAAGLRIGEPVGAERHLVESAGRLGKAHEPGHGGNDRSAHLRVPPQCGAGARRTACVASPSPGKVLPPAFKGRPFEPPPANDYHRRRIRKRRIQI